VGWKIIYETGIRRLFEIIHDGMKGRISNREFAIIYTTVYNMCLQNKTYQHSLYDRFCTTITTHLTTECKPAIFDNDKHDEFILGELVRQYRSYKFLVKWLIQTFGYLDRQYVKRFHKPPLRKVAVKQFKEIIFTAVKTRCIPIALDLISRDRDASNFDSDAQNCPSSPVDRTVLRDFISMFIDVKGGDLRAYREDFEHLYLDETTQYYLRRAQRMQQTLSCSQYLTHCERIMEAEQQREIDYLHHVTHAELLKRLYAVLLVGPQNKIIHRDDGVYAMMRAEDYHSLALLFKLYSMVPHTLPMICRVVSRRVQDEAAESLRKAYHEKNTRVFVETLLTLYAHHEAMISRCFANHADFSKALSDAYSVILNAQRMFDSNSDDDATSNSQSKTRSVCELLSTYIDLAMRVDGGVRLSEDELETRLSEIVKLFAYVHDKDVFIGFYRRQLAKRLLTGKSASEHAELRFMAQLKLRCGAQLTSKLEGMIADMGRSREHEERFTNYIQRKKSRANFTYEFGVKVLTSGFWPSFGSANDDGLAKLMLPRSMKRAEDFFGKYFAGLHEKRLLRWVHDLGTATVIGHFEAKSVVLEVSTLQCCVLLILNQIGSIKICDMTRMLGVSEVVMKRQLKPLCSRKFHVLLKNPSKGYDTKHSLSMNMAWNPPKKRYRIPTGVHKVSQAEREGNVKQVFGDRRLMMEAAIVRVMKTRKRVKHNLLVATVSQHLMHRFKVDPKLVKERIADLIEREYLQRDDKDSQLYLYVH